MAQYIVLLIISITFLSALYFLIKAIKPTISLSTANSPLNNSELILKNNLEELEIDFMSQKIDEKEYNNLKELFTKNLNSINQSSSTNKEEKYQETIKITNKKLICQACKKEIENDSKFCKYCGNKITI